PEKCPGGDKSCNYPKACTRPSTSDENHLVNTTAIYNTATMRCEDTGPVSAPRDCKKFRTLDDCLAVRRRSQRVPGRRFEDEKRSGSASNAGSTNKHSIAREKCVSASRRSGAPVTWLSSYPLSDALAFSVSAAASRGDLPGFFSIEEAMSKATRHRPPRRDVCHRQRPPGRVKRGPKKKWNLKRRREEEKENDHGRRGKTRCLPPPATTWACEKRTEKEVESETSG
ncbi:hypothetical protein HPB47_013797, partial [Ixodes persulcatus]